MARVRRQARRCSARRSSDGQPCRAFAIIGGTVCSAHGGSAPAVRWAAFWRVEEQRMRAFVYRGVEWQRRRQVKVEAKRLLEAADVLGISIDEAAAWWPTAWVVATLDEPQLTVRHERRLRDLEEQEIRMRDRWLAQHLNRVERAVGA